MVHVQSRLTGGSATDFHIFRAVQQYQLGIAGAMYATPPLWISHKRPDLRGPTAACPTCRNAADWKLPGWKLSAPKDGGKWMGSYGERTSVLDKVH